MEKNAKVSIQYDAFVKAVRPDSKATENTMFLEGFIGESSLTDHFRLYSDASLNDFVEIPTSAVIHSIAHSKEESALGGSKIWVKKDAIFTYGNPAMDNRPQGSFLDGDLYQGYMDNMYQADTGSGNMGNMGGGFENMASRPLCEPLPQTIFCPVASRFCPQSRFVCPPVSRFGCPTRLCPSKLFCPTFGACPSIACDSLACNPGGGGRPFEANQGMTDQFGGNFNPYFDGDLNKAYMENMYQPQADAGMGNMGGGMENMAPTALCGTGPASIACPVRTITVGCSEPSRFVICNPISRFTPCFSQSQFGCFTRRNDSRCCVIDPRRTWTRPTTIFTTTTFPTTTRIDQRFDPRINPGNIGGGFGQMGDFDGSFNPYNGY